MSQVQAIGGLLTYLMKGARRNALETGRKAMGPNDGRGRDRARGSLSNLTLRRSCCVCVCNVVASDGFLTVRSVGSFIMSGFMHISPVSEQQLHPPPFIGASEVPEQHVRTLALHVLCRQPSQH